MRGRSHKTLSLFLATRGLWLIALDAIVISPVWGGPGRILLGTLARAGLPGFPLTVAGDEVERSKPDPLPYLRAAGALGIDVTRAIVLEDSANGVRAASEAGAVVVAVPHAVPIEPAARIHVRPSVVGLGLADLRRLVADE